MPFSFAFIVDPKIPSLLWCMRVTSLTSLDN